MSMSHHKLEEGTTLNLDYLKLQKIAAQGNEVVPVAVQNIDTLEIILVAYINEEALNHSLKSGTATFWSTSRNELWIKGATSGATFDLCDAFINCEQNSVVFKVRPRKEDICHTKNKEGKARNCYYRKINATTQDLENLNP